MSGGEGGIRTRETSHPAYALSRRAYSSTLAPLRGRKEADPHVRASNSMQLWRFLCQPAYRPRMETNPVCGLLKSVAVSSGGEGGIRTRDTRKRIPLFESGAFNHSATSPRPKNQGIFRWSLYTCRSIVPNLVKLHHIVRPLTLCLLLSPGPLSTKLWFW